MQTKAIKFCAETGKITRLPNRDLKTLQDAVGGYIELCAILPNGDEVYCNEEGLLHNPKFFVAVYNAHDPIAGNIVIVGQANAKGEFTDPDSTDDQVNYWCIKSTHQDVIRYLAWKEKKQIERKIV